MSEPHQKLTTRTQAQSTAAQVTTHVHQQQATTAREFANPEELLRADASRTEVPPGIERRLRESVGGDLEKPSGWWRRLFRR